MFIACDESGTSSSAKYLVIGSVWIAKNKLSEVEGRITELRLKRKCWGEIEWSKVRKSMSDEIFKMYQDFLALTFQDIPISFKCIVVKKSLLDMRTFHERDEELMRFKFIYLLLSRPGKRLLHINKNLRFHVIFDEFEQSTKSKEEKRVLRMKAFIERHLGVPLEHLQPCNSHICSLVQLCDLLTGAVSTSWNQSPPRINEKKQELITYIKNKSGKKLTTRTLPTEKDFNIWVWQPSPFR